MPATREIVTVVGRSGSGKTHHLAHHVAPKHPRRITFDLTGETAELYPDAVPLYGARETFRVLSKLWNERADRWHLCVSATRADADAIVSMLCPLHDGRAVSLARAWDGIALECFELDAFFPTSAPDDSPWRTAYQRGRHVGLSLLCATQYPALVHRAATSQATTIVLFSLVEPRQVDYARSLLGERGELVRSLPAYNCLEYNVAAAAIVQRDANGRELARWSLADSMA